jgi:hypothetical protein
MVPAASCRACRYPRGENTAPGNTFPASQAIAIVSAAPGTGGVISVSGRVVSTNGNFELCNLPGLVGLMMVWRNILWIQVFGGFREEIRRWRTNRGFWANFAQRSLVSAASFSHLAKKLASSGL